jgi:PEGA domain
VWHAGMIRVGLALISTATLVAGCAGVAKSGNQAGMVKIISEPAGAVVYADGREVGLTPTTIAPANYFHSGFVGFSYRYYGNLTIRKAGCAPWAADVDDAILSKDVVAKLECKQSLPISSASVSLSGTTTDSVSDSDSMSRDRYVDRLERIETLHRKGLISDVEYKQLRTRILNEL